MTKIRFHGQGIGALDARYVRDTADVINDTHIDWGVGANQVSADDIPDGATNAIITLTQETNFEAAYSHIHNLTTDIDHDALLNFAANEHFTEASISHANILNIGTNTHAQIDTFIGTTVPTTYAPLVSPTLVTPEIGVATGTSLDLGGTTLLASRALTVDTGGVFNIVLASAAGDDFTVDTDKLVVEGDTGNVGIGTTGPDGKLHVALAANEAVYFGTDNVQSAVLNTTNSFIFNIDSNNNQSDQHFKIKTNGTDYDDGTALFTVLETGNVGIGTTGPGYKLEIVTAQDSIDGINIKEIDDSRIAFLGDANSTSETGVLKLWREGVQTVNISARDTHDSYINAGNVGIGTTSPIGKLQVGTNTFSGGNGIYADSRIGAMVNGALTSIVYASTYNNPTYPDYGLVFIHGPDTSNYNVWSISPDGPAKGDGLSFIYGANSTNIHVTTPKVYFDGNGNVGIGTTGPGAKLAVNKSSDGTIVNFESADTVEGSVSISGTTTSYNAFLGSHYTQLKDGQKELPVGAVVVSTGEIIPCERNKDVETVKKVEVAVKDAIETIEIPAIEAVKEVTEVQYYVEDGKILSKEVVITEAQEAVSASTEKKLKENHVLDEKTGKIYREDKTVTPVPQDVSKKEYFTYVDTTITPGDKRVYGVWFSKLEDDSKDMSFGKNGKPVYLIAQVGLFKIRVTDTNGDIAVGDFLETSTRAMEAQKQASENKVNSTVAKALTNVKWADVAVDKELGYKVKLIPCIF